LEPTAAGDLLKGLSWFWIALAMTVPPPVALLVAWPFWRKTQMIFGNLVGTGVLFGTAFAMIFREHAELDILIQRCLDDGFLCIPEPSAFTRFALYAFISLFQVFALFTLSLFVEERMRRRNYAPEWR
jgi:hypothetical protein